MKAYRHADGSIWTFRPDQRRQVRPLAPAAWPCRSCRPSLHRVAQALVEVDQDWVPSSEHGEASLYLRPFMFASEAFLGVRPAAQVTYCVIASPAGPYFTGGLKPVSIWLSSEYVRAAPGGTGAAKCGGNYAASLAAQVEAVRPRLRPGRLPRRGRAPVGRGARRHEPLLRACSDGTHRHTRAHRHASSRASPATRSSSSPRSWATSVDRAPHLDRRVARGRRLRRHRRGLRLRDRCRRHPRRPARVGRRRGRHRRQRGRGRHLTGSAPPCSTSSTGAPRTPTAGWSAWSRQC